MGYKGKMEGLFCELGCERVHGCELNALCAS